MDGAIYIAVGQEYIDLAEISARSLRKHAPDLQLCLCLYSDTPVRVWRIWDRVIELDLNVMIKPVERKGPRVAVKGSAKNIAMGIKARMLGLSPYERTVFLDCDTVVISDKITFPFQLFDKGDIFVKPSPQPKVDIYWKRFPELKNKDISKEAKHYSSGVVYFKKCNAVEKLNALWQEEWHYLKDVAPPDQLAFSIALNKMSDSIKLLELDPAFNYSKGDMMLRSKRKAVVLHYQNYGYGNPYLNKILKAYGAKLA